MKRWISFLLTICMLFSLLVLPAAAAGAPDVRVDAKTGAVSITVSGAPGDTATVKIERDGKRYYLDSAYLDASGQHTFHTILPREMEFSAAVNVAGTLSSFIVSTKDTGKPDPKPEKKTVSLSVDLKTIGKGYIISPTTVEISDGDTVWDVLKSELDRRGIPYEYEDYSQYDSVYVQSIDKVGEFDNGPGSGWMYNVDGIYPEYGCSRYVLHGGERIQWRYTTNLGEDLGENVNGGQTGKPEEGGSSIITPEVKPDKNGNAQVIVDETQMKDAIATAKTEGCDAIVIAPKITGKATRVTAEMPTRSLKDVVKNTDASLEVQTGVGSVSIPNDALDAIVQQADSNKVTVTVEVKDVEAVKDQVSASRLKGATVVEVTITSGKKEITTFGRKPLTITIPVTGSAFAANEDYKVLVLSAGGAEEVVSGTCAKRNGKLSVQVKITHLSTFVVTTEKVMPFTDVSGHWAAEAIAYVYGTGLMNGTSETTFAPNESLNRAMLVTILYRLAGEPAVIGESKTFIDVAPDTWYTSAVVWGSTNGIVSGIGNDQFAPMQAITREQLATMLYRYTQYSRLDTSAKGDLSKFTDSDQVSSWASDAMMWAVGAGLITGKTANVIDPTGTATRAEVATILMRFTELTK